MPDEPEMTLEGLYQRIIDLEKKVARYARATGVAPLVKDPTAWLLEVLPRIDSLSLQTIIRELPRGSLAPTFAGFPRLVMANLKTAVSKRTWEDMVEVWRRGHCGPSEYHHNELVRVIYQLEVMGMVVATDRKAIVEEWLSEPREVNDLDYEAERREELEKAKRWIETELAGLI